MLRFEPDGHRYYWNGVRVPSVTSILAPLTDYSRMPRAVMDRARQEGEHIHKMIELYLANNLDEKTLPDWLRPRLVAFRKFQVQTGFRCEASERAVYHVAHQYAGRLDLVGELGGQLAVIDIKRSLFAGAVIGLQLAAYQEAENDGRKRASQEKTKLRYALQLRDDATYRLEPYTEHTDFAVFLAFLTAHKWRQQHESAD